MSHEGGNNVLRLNHQLQGRDLIFKKVKEVSGGQFSFKSRDRQWRSLQTRERVLKATGNYLSA